MEPEAIDIDEYLKSGVEERFYFLYRNYPILTPIIKSYREDIITDVADMKAYNRRNSNEGLGVRVQISIGVSNPTERMAISNITIAKAIDEGILDDDFFQDTDDPMELVRRVNVYHRVKKDYATFSQKLDTLDPEEQRLIKTYLLRQKKLSDMAEEFGMEYRSLTTRLYKIRKKLSDKVEPRLMKGVNNGV